MQGAIAGNDSFTVSNVSPSHRLTILDWQHNQCHSAIFALHTAFFTQACRLFYIWWVSAPTLPSPLSCTLPSVSLAQALILLQLSQHSRPHTSCFTTDYSISPVHACVRRKKYIYNKTKQLIEVKRTSCCKRRWREWPRWLVNVVQIW